MSAASVALALKVDRVRLAIGDTDVSDPLLTDDEIETLIAEWPDNLTMAAAKAAEAIYAVFSRQFDFSTDGQSFHLSQRAAAYRQLAYSLSAKATGGYSIPTPSSLSAAVADQIPFGE